MYSTNIDPMTVVQSRHTQTRVTLPLRALCQVLLSSFLDSSTDLPGVEGRILSLCDSVLFTRGSENKPTSFGGADNQCLGGIWAMHVLCKPFLILPPALKIGGPDP